MSKTGISVLWIKVYSICQGTVLLFAYLLGKILNKNFLTVFTPHGIDVTSIFIILVIGWALTGILLGVKIQEYSLLEFIFAILKPKKAYEQNGMLTVHSDYKINCLIENILKGV